MDRDLVKKKLRELRRYVAELKKFQGKNLASLEDSLSDLWAIEHGLQLAIQCVIDIGNHLLASMGSNQIEDYVDVIDNLGKNKILPPAFARRIRSMAGFRNILVHEYADVDLSIVHRVLNHRLSDFPAFIQHIERYLTHHK